jgi:cytochrome c oxidase subunit 1
MILAMICISIFGSIVWGHHIYVVGLEIETKIYFTNVTLMISLPTGTKIYNWLSIYLGLLISTRLLSLSFSIIFILVFTIGGVTGIILGNDIIDLTLHDSYYVVAHFHFILSIGALISLLAGLLFLKELLFSSFLRFYIIKLNRYYFILIFISINFIFIPLFYNIMPRRILEFPDFINS